MYTSAARQAIASSSDPTPLADAVESNDDAVGQSHGANKPAGGASIFSEAQGPGGRGLPFWEGVTLEPCAGLLDDPSLTVVQTAVKEIHEELGYKVTAAAVRYVGSSTSAVGTGGNAQHLCYCEVRSSQREAGAGGGLEEEGEFIEVAEVCPEQLLAVADPDPLRGVGGGQPRAPASNRDRIEQQLRVVLGLVPAGVTTTLTEDSTVRVPKPLTLPNHLISSLFWWVQSRHAREWEARTGKHLLVGVEAGDESSGTERDCGHKGPVPSAPEAAIASAVGEQDGGAQTASGGVSIAVPGALALMAAAGGAAIGAMLASSARSKSIDPAARAQASLVEHKAGAGASGDATGTRGCGSRPGWGGDRGPRRAFTTVIGGIGTALILASAAVGWAVMNRGKGAK